MLVRLLSSCCHEYLNELRSFSTMFAWKEGGLCMAIRTVALSFWCHFAPQAASIFSAQCKILIENDVITLGGSVS